MKQGFIFQISDHTIWEKRQIKENILPFRAVPGIFGTQQAQYLDVIKQMLQQCFTDQNNPQVYLLLKGSTA